MNINDISKGTKQYLFNTLDELSETDFIFSIAKPIIKTGIENNFNKVENTLKFIADEKGNIDIEKLINDTITSIFNGKKATYSIGSIGSIDFGNDVIQINILNKIVKFTSKDFIKFKDYLVNNYEN